MRFLISLVEWGTQLCRWGAVITAAAMALLIPYTVLMRALGTPMGGDSELIELMMVVLVMLGLAYTQKARGHIAIGLLVDHFPRWAQVAADLLAVVLIVAGCALIGWANLRVAYEYATVIPMSTDFLSVPLYPFKIIVGLGFWLWALQAMVNFGQDMGNKPGDCGSIGHGAQQ